MFMQKYKTTIEKPCLEIYYDDDTMSPRENTILGYFLTKDSNYYSPDGKDNPILQNIMEETGEIAESLENHIELMTERIQEETGCHVEDIYPIVKYEHSGVAYSLGAKHGFDYSNNGFYIITTESKKEMGAEKKDFEMFIEEELNLYNKYVNGEVYRFVLFDKDGEVEDACSGFYDIEDIREHLPKEWAKESLTDYLIN